MDKTVLITGASRGIGKACAERFAKEGARLALCCHKNMNMLEQFASELKSEYGVTVKCYCGDVGNYDFVVGMYRDVSTYLKKPDIVINNAGISVVDLFTSLTPAMWKEVIDTNLTSVYNVCSACVPAMTAAGEGRIINISSVWGNVGASCEVAYSASQGGVNAFTRALAKELAPSGVSVNAIAFGCIDTEMNGHLSDAEKKELAEEIPAGRMATAEEAADFVYKIATSPAYLTGQVVTFDGAWL